MNRPLLIATVVLCASCAGKTVDDGLLDSVDGTYQMEGTFGAFANLVYGKEAQANCATAGSPRRYKTEIRVSEGGTQIEFAYGCKLEVQNSRGILTAKNATCQIVPGSSLASNGTVESVYEHLEFNVAAGEIHEFKRTATTNTFEKAPTCFIAQAVTSTWAAREKRLRALWSYANGEYTTSEEKPLGTEECGVVVASGGKPAGPIREYDDGKFQVEGWDCRAPLQPEAITPGQPLVECVPGPHHPADLPSLWIRQFSLTGGRLILDGEWRKADFRYCMHLEASAERVPPN